MCKKISIHLLAGILLVIVAYPLYAQEQLPVVSNKSPTVTVPKVVGMLQKDAEAAITAAGLKVANVIERETQYPDSQVLRQQPKADAKAAKGSGVVLMVSKAKGQIQIKTPVAPSGTTPSGEVQLKNEWFGGQAKSVVAALRAAGLTVKPNIIAGDKRRGTVMGMTMADRRLTPGNLLDRGSTVTLEISGGPDYKPPTGGVHQAEEPDHPGGLMPVVKIITTNTLMMTGKRVKSQTITTQPIQMTGKLAASQTIITAPLQMTGMRTVSKTITTSPLQMTGKRPESQTITTQPLQMTGKRVNSITINTAPLKMTGMRP